MARVLDSVLARNLPWQFRIDPLNIIMGAWNQSRALAWLCAISLVMATSHQFWERREDEHFRHEERDLQPLQSSMSGLMTCSSA